jgi:hypothetical protein
MRVSEAFTSEFLKAADLRDRNIIVVIDHVEMKDIGGDHKPILFFQGKDKGLVLNKTNANNIAMGYGDDTDDWTGKEIVLFPAMVDFQGKTVSAIRVRMPRPSDKPKAVVQVVSGGAAAVRTAPEPPPISDDDIPF